MRYIAIISLLAIFLISCAPKVVHSYSNAEIDKYDMLLTKSNKKLYDIRSEEDCIEGRIPGFICMRPKNSDGVERSLDKIFEYITLVLGNDYKYLIVLIDDNGQDAKFLAEKLLDAGYYNVHYYEGGYNSYVEIKGESFIPETGECNVC